MAREKTEYDRRGTIYAASDIRGGVLSMVLAFT